MTLKKLSTLKDYLRTCVILFLMNFMMQKVKLWFSVIKVATSCQPGIGNNSIIIKNLGLIKLAVNCTVELKYNT